MASDAYLQIDGIKGESADSGHQGWIELQYAHSNLLTLIFQIERAWQAMYDRKFGIGNISIDGGFAYDNHQSHRKGIEMDCRPVRKDYVTGQGARCTYRDKEYDLDATINLIRLFVEHPWIKIAYFNDDRVQKALGARASGLSWATTTTSTSSSGRGTQRERAPDAHRRGPCLVLADPGRREPGESELRPEAPEGRVLDIRRRVG